MKVGFIGLGTMGSAMARDLIKAGHALKVYNRTTSRAEELRPLGATGARGPGEAASDAEALITMLADDRAVEQVVFAPGNAVESLHAGAVHISMSTISTAAAARLAAEHALHGQGYVAAPVFGNPDAARQRQLFIVAAGATADVERGQPLFDVLGQTTFVIGTDPGHANLVKLLGNMMTATTLEILGEVVAVARKRGLDPKPFIDIMTSTMFGGRAHRIYGDKIVRQSYAPGFVLPLVLKDVRLALAEAESAGAPMPSVDVVRDRLIAGIARGYADLDWTALGLVAAEEAGLSRPARAA
jgi:3-hydroxyisobutyrate dehydrogenase-like beta-hydroxyacid dehydrogenase